MTRVNRSPEQKGRVALLTSIGKEIAAHEASLLVLRQTEKKLIKQYERGKCADDLEQLRALVINYENGVGL